jgi:hypothetical protein
VLTEVLAGRPPTLFWRSIKILLDLFDRHALKFSPMMPTSLA